METAAIIFMLAIIVEALIEYFGQPLPATWKPYAGAVVGVLLCLAYGADLLARFGFPARLPYVGEVLTGLLIGRGANVFNDLASRLVPLRSVARVVVSEQTTQRGAGAVVSQTTTTETVETTGTDPGTEVNHGPTV